MTVILIFPVVGLLYCIYMLRRNKLVHDMLIKTLNEDFETFKKLPEYNKILFSFKPVKLKYWVK